MLSNPSIGMADLVFVPSDKLEKEYEGNLFVGEKSYSRFILRFKHRKGLCSQAGEYLENSKNNIRKSSAIYDDECKIYNLYIFAYSWKLIENI
jgi:hypothetical protein